MKEEFFLRPSISIFLLASIILYIGYHFMFNDSAVNSNQTNISLNEITNAEPKNTEESLAMVTEGSLGALIGKDVQNVLAELGSPRRKDLTAYGYIWYIYNYDINHYVQVGVLNVKVVTVFAIGNDVNVTPYKIGQSFDELSVNHSILNSQGHRESLLSGEFTHLGVGVYQKYSTQNFIKN